MLHARQADSDRGDGFLRTNCRYNPSMWLLSVIHHASCVTLGSQEILPKMDSVSYYIQAGKDSLQSFPFWPLDNDLDRRVPVKPFLFRHGLERSGECC